jgi:hypothetical protein
MTDIEEITESLEIQNTHNTPYVLFKPDGHLLIHGRYIPEDISEFSDILMDWVRVYIQSPANTTKLRLELEYINDASKYLLLIIKELQKNCPKFTVDWVHEKGDDDMLELGNTICASCGSNFTFIETG